jgi:hypothetical protein
MPATPNNHDAHEYAERIRKRLQRRLQELREACDLSMYVLWMKSSLQLRPIRRYTVSPLMNSGIRRVAIAGSVPVSASRRAEVAMRRA